MNLSELLTDVRALLDDALEPYLWSDELLTIRANNAVDETCIRTRLLHDSTSSVTGVTLVADQASYALDASVYAVRRVALAGQREPLALVNARQLDEWHPGWDDTALSSAGTPRYAVFDLDTHSLRLHPRPSVVGTLRMTVWRRATENERLETPADDPVIPEHYHRLLKHWIAYECWSDQDAEKHDPQRAAEQLALFESFVGHRPSMHEMRLWSTSRIRGTRAHFV